MVLLIIQLIDYITTIEAINNFTSSYACVLWLSTSAEKCTGPGKFFVSWSTQPLYKSYLSMSHSVEGRKGFFVQLLLGDHQQLVELALLLS